MLKKKNFVLFALAMATAVGSLTLAASSGSSGNRCGCEFTGRKDYQDFTETKNFWRKRKVHRAWSCEYSCDAGQGAEKVLGHYEMTNVGEDSGLEGICEGTVYESEFNGHLMREVYNYKETRGFNPKKADAKEVLAWAQSHDCK